MSTKEEVIEQLKVTEESLATTQQELATTKQELADKTAELETLATEREKATAAMQAHNMERPEQLELAAAIRDHFQRNPGGSITERANDAARICFEKMFPMLPDINDDGDTPPQD